MVGPFSHLSRRSSGPAPRISAAIALIAIAFAGSSISLGALTNSSEPEPARPASQSNIAALSETIKNHPGDAQAYNMRGAAQAQAGKSEEALADFNKAIAPDNAEAYYNRGLLYQGERQHQSAIHDFTVANGLVPQQAEPLLAGAELSRHRPAEAGRG